MEHAELFLNIGEFFAAGLFELEGEAPVIRYANALKRFWEKTKLPAYDGGLLYPCGYNPFSCNEELCVQPHYANTMLIREKAMQDKSAEAYALIMEEDRKTAKFQSSPHTVGGMGWTHSFPNYTRILQEGLWAYKRRVEALEEGDFKRSLQILLEGIDIFHSRCLEHLRGVQAPAALIRALERVPYETPEDVYQAVVSLNFIYYVDGCDDIGPLDKILLPYHRGEDLVPLLRDFYQNVDVNNGWSGTLGPDYNAVTRDCLRAAHNSRRPSFQLLVKPQMPDWMWEEVVASLATGCGQPALYNYDLYMEQLSKKLSYIPLEDRKRLAFGGCTETMLEGISNVGSDDAGVNVALIFSDYMRANLAQCPTWECFFDGLAVQIRQVVADTLDLVLKYRRTRAEHRPSMVRTLLVDDCIETGKEFHNGGARWYWSCVNMAGVVNVIDSLNVIKTLIYDQKLYTAEQFLEKMDAADPDFLAKARKCPTFGNDNNQADLLGNALLEVVTKAFEQRECFPSGKFYPVSNQFNTYVGAGKNIPATPDGRVCGGPLCDSMGAIHGNDNQGPTALLNSVAKLDVKKVIGTPVTNIRISKQNLPQVLKPLVLSFFEKGGMQLQVSCLSREEMLDALEHPEAHRNLIVRIGGFSEYFNNLSQEMKLTVIARTEH